MQANLGSLLVVKSELFPEFINELTDYLRQDNPAISIVTKMDFNKNNLFGYYVFWKENRELNMCKVQFRKQLMVF